MDTQSRSSIYGNAVWNLKGGGGQQNVRSPDEVPKWQILQLFLFDFGERVLRLETGRLLPTYRIVIRAPVFFCTGDQIATWGRQCCNLAGVRLLFSFGGPVCWLPLLVS